MGPLISIFGFLSSESEILDSESEEKIGELDSLMVPAGLSGMEMTALEYLESEGDLAKTYEEILEATRDNFKRTSLEAVQNAQKRFEALLDDAIR